MQSPNLAGLSATPVRSPSRRTVKSGKFGPSEEPRLIGARVMAIGESETKSQS
jgi:hypothetical protein